MARTLPSSSVAPWAVAKNQRQNMIHCVTAPRARSGTRPRRRSSIKTSTTCSRDMYPSLSTPMPNPPRLRLLGP
eukprot:4498390-Lingulodinium_polyedra.AAC.1